MIERKIALFAQQDRTFLLARIKTLYNNEASQIWFNEDGEKVEILDPYQHVPTFADVTQGKQEEGSDEDTEEEVSDTTESTSDADSIVTIETS
jgi:hypothetical protein